MKYLIILSICLLASCQPSKQEKTETGDNDIEAPGIEESADATEAEEISDADASFMNALMADLKGIEKFFVADSYHHLLALLKYKTDTLNADKVESLLSKTEDNPNLVNITLLDAKAGYIEFEALQAEGFFSSAYWNQTDGKQLIGHQAKYCGPICESEISFTRYLNGEYEQVETSEIIPEIDSLMAMQLQEVNGYIEPFEYEFILPRKGKDIRYCLESNCLVLKWMDGRFVIQN